MNIMSGQVANHNWVIQSTKEPNGNFIFLEISALKKHNVWKEKKKNHWVRSKAH